MVCKKKTKSECLASGDCIWVQTKNSNYCRKKPSRSTRSQEGHRQQTRNLKQLTLKELKVHPNYKRVIGRSKMNKTQLVQALQLLGQQRQQTPMWSNKCKKLEKNCPMSSTLLGDEWCDVDEKNVIYTSNYNMCFEYRELLRMIHEGFVALDTSYQLPPLRLKLPRDPVRKFIPKSVVKNILLNKEAFYENDDFLMDNEEMFYFLVHLDDFYKTFDKPEYTSPDVNPVFLSRELEKWFKKYKSPAGGLTLVRSEGGREIGWRFKKYPESYSIVNGKLKLHMK